MTIPIRILHPDGQLLESPIKALSLNDLALVEPEGIYTVTRTYDRTKTVLLDAHLDRLELSARLEKIELKLERKKLRSALASLIDESGFTESRLRITIPKLNPSGIWLAVEPLSPVPPLLKRNGVRVGTCIITRPNPRAKSNAWISQRQLAGKGIPKTAYEGVVISDEGYLMEGFSSNIYMFRSGLLYTADQGVLHGIARRIVMLVAPGRVDLKLEPLHRDELPHIDEAFLTSSSRGIVPIIQIDDLEIGKGKPGPVTMALSTAYDEWVLGNLESISGG